MTSSNDQPNTGNGPGGEDCPAAVSLAGLARTVEALERRADQLSGVNKRVDELAALVARLAQLAADRGHDGDESERPPCWLDLGRPGSFRDAEEVLDHLAGWVAGIYLRYSDARLPACWLWHPDVVEELLWLHCAWLAAHEPGATPTAVGDWHDRQRPGVIRRIKEYAGTCSLEAHQPGGQRHTPAPAAPTVDAVPAIAGWWATGRDQPAPAPTDRQLGAASGHRTSRGRR